MDLSTTSIESVDALFERLKTSPTGLSSLEAKKRQEEYGINHLAQEQVVWVIILLRQLKSPFMYLLFAAAIIAFFLGNYMEALMILFFVVVNTFLGFYQEYKAHQTVQMLKKILISEVKVWRDNHRVMVDSKTLVPGDVIMLEPGDIIPADVRFIEEHDLMVDESVLTGESVPIKKVAEPLKEPALELFDAFNIGSAGTVVVEGKAVGVVIAIGQASVMGSIAKLTSGLVRESIFAREIAQFSHVILILISITLSFVFIMNLIIKGANANIGQLLIFSIALAVTITPEALPLVITFCLSRGALNLARNKVIVKRLSAIEDLGSIDILCSDKTGTLTENKLSVADVYGADQRKTLLYANLACAAGEANNYHLVNPIDKALWLALAPQDHAEFKNYHRRYEIPFDPLRLRNNVVVQVDHIYDLIVRGVVETTLDRCMNCNKEEVINWAAQQEKQGKRVLVIAQKSLSDSADFKTEALNEKDLNFIGMIALLDPIKRDVIDAFVKAKKLGIVVKILTGDSPEVAGAVGYKIGLIKNPIDVITGAIFNGLSLEQQKRAVYDYAIFARVTPEQKYTIIKLLQEKNQVGYLGEGINDAPALKIAHVGLAVQGAAENAREAADIILLKKSLNIIVDGIYEGRRVYANTIKYIKTTLAANFGNFYSVALSSLFINFLPMLPLQILLVNFLSDFPMIALSSDTVDSDELRNPKRYTIKDIVLFSIILGIVSSLFDFIIFAFFYRISPQVLQTNWFIESILTELVLIFSLRTHLIFYKARFPSIFLLLLSIIAFIITIGLPFTEFGQTFFGFIKPTFQQLTVVMVVVILCVIATEVTKIGYYRLFNHRKSDLPIQ